MDYQLTEEKSEHYETYKDKVIKIQSLIRQRYWFLSYIKIIKNHIENLFERERKPYVHEPTLFGDNSEENIKHLEIAFQQKQRQMKQGDLGQLIIGNWYGWKDLKVGHSSGLDCCRKDNSIIMECKNNFNTVKGSDIKKSLYPTLAAYKKENPQTRCVWGIVNPKPGSKKLHKNIIHDDIVIEKIQGLELFKLVFTIGKIDYSSRIINIVKDIISKYH